MKSITRSAVTNAIMSPVDSPSRLDIDVNTSSTKRLMNNIGDSVDALAPRKAVMNGSGGSLELNLQFFAKEGGSGITELSKSNIQHIKKHTFDGMAEQAKHLTDEQLANKLKNTSLFNKNWSQNEIIEYTQEAYNRLRSQGKTGLQSIEINGEIINVFIKDDGAFDTAYGIYRYTVEDFR